MILITLQNWSRATQIIFYLWVHLQQRRQRGSPQELPWAPKTKRGYMRLQTCSYRDSHSKPDSNTWPRDDIYVSAVNINVNPIVWVDFKSNYFVVSVSLAHFLLNLPLWPTGYPDWWFYHESSFASAYNNRKFAGDVRVLLHQHITRESLQGILPVHAS